MLAIGATAIVLLTTWGGTQYAWGSWQIMLLARVTAAAIGRVLLSSRAGRPSRSCRCTCSATGTSRSPPAMSFLLGFAMLGALTFLPLYQQTVQHVSPTASGLMLIPLMLGSTVTSLIAGQVTTRTGRYKALPIIGGAIMTVAHATC